MSRRGGVDGKAGNAIGRWFSSLAPIVSLLVLGFLPLTSFADEKSVGRPSFVAASSDSTFPCVRGDPVLGHALREGCDEIARRAGRDYRMRINSYGLRGGETPAKQPNEFRVLLLGSSGLFGVGVTEENTISALAQAQLEKETGKKVTVLNAGVEGYFIVQNYLRLPDLLKKVKPDLVVLVLSAGDGFFKDLSLLQRVCRLDNRGLPVGCARDPGEGLPSFFKNWIYRIESLFFSVFTIRMFMDRISISHQIRSLSSTSDKANLLVGSFVPLIKEMSQVSKKSGAEFRVFNVVLQLRNSFYLGDKLSVLFSRMFHSLESDFVIPASFAEEIFERDLGHLFYRNSSEFRSQWRLGAMDPFMMREDAGHNNEEGLKMQSKELVRSILEHHSK